MAQYRSRTGMGQILSRAGLAVALVAGVLVYVLGASTDPRLEPLRRIALDISAPITAVVGAPFRFIGDRLSGLGGSLDVYEQNRALREDIVQLNQWREVARRFEEENARLRALHNVALAPKYDYVTAQVVAASGGGFAHAVTINVGRNGSVEAGAVALDGGGVVGRVVSTGRSAARILLLSDLASRVPVYIEGAEVEDENAEDEDRKEKVIRAILVGDNQNAPLIEFVSEIDDIEAGRRIFTSSDGGIFPKGLPIGEIERNGDEIRARLAANFDRLEFVRILLDRSDRTIDADAVLIVSPDRESGEGDAADGPAE